MEDNQFRKKTGEDAYAAKRSKKPLDDNEVFDLYGEFKDPNAGKLDPEVEELKLLAQSDALKAYAWVRRKLTALNEKFSKLNFQVTPKQIKLAKIAVVVVAAGTLLVRIVPNIYQNVTEEGGILGEADPVVPTFPVLTTNGAVQEGLVFDKDVSIASYQDEVGGLLATVSQQPMPPAVKADQSGVEKLALSMSDKSIINRYETEKGQIYVVEAQNTAQTVIFGYKDLLIFIRSSGNIADELWVDYVNHLQLRS